MITWLHKLKITSIFHVILQQILTLLIQFTYTFALVPIGGHKPTSTFQFSEKYCFSGKMGKYYFAVYSNSPNCAKHHIAPTSHNFASVPHIPNKKYNQIFTTITWDKYCWQVYNQVSSLQKYLHNIDTCWNKNQKKVKGLGPVV